MNEIKKAIDQIPLPEQLSEITQKSLQLPIKKKKYWLLSSVAVLFLVIFSSSFVFSDYISISDFFKSKEEKLAQIDDTELVVQSDEFTISLKRFIDYKENTLLIHELNNYPYTLTDEDLINRMIENELLYVEAKKAGISVEKEEVESYIAQVKLALTEANDHIQNIQNEIDAQLAKALNIEVAEYYTHPVTFAKYERVLLEGKFVQKLYVNGELNEQYNVEHYKKDLRLANEKDIKIYTDKLK